MERGELGGMTMKTGSLPRSGWAYIAATFVAAGGAGLLLASTHNRASALGGFFWITTLGMAAHAFPIHARRHQAYQVTLPFIVMAAALFDFPQLMAFTVLIHAAEQARVHRPLHIQFFNLCNYFLSGVAAALVYQRAIGLMPVTTLSRVEAAMAAGCAFIILNRVLLAGVLWVARGLSPARCGLFKPELLAADLVIIWTSGPMLVLSTRAGAWIIPVLAGPLLVARPALAALLADPEKPREERPARAA